MLGMWSVVALVVGGGLLAGCAALAGISDSPDDAEASDASADVGFDSSDAGKLPVDASPADVTPAPTTASVTVRCNGTVVAKYACADKRWEYDFAPCTATPRKVVLENTGTLPIAFIARRAWTGTSYVPNQVTDGQSGELVGVIAAAAKVDVSAAYNGGIFALVGSVSPFDAAALTAPMRDEGKVATTKAMLGTLATNGVLDVAELTATSQSNARCTTNAIVFKKK